MVKVKVPIADFVRRIGYTRADIDNVWTYWHLCMNRHAYSVCRTKPCRLVAFVGELQLSKRGREVISRLAGASAKHGNKSVLWSAAVGGLKGVGCGREIAGRLQLAKEDETFTVRRVAWERRGRAIRA